MSGIGNLSSGSGGAGSSTNNNSNTGSKDIKVRLHVSNIPYDLRWQDLKDLFKEKVGSEVCYVEIYEGLDGKSTGAGVIEVKGRDLADRAIDLLHRSELKGRQLVVREEKDKDKQLYCRYQNPSSTLGMDVMNNGMNASSQMNSSAVIPGAFQLLCQLGIDADNITNQIFVANLDYNVTVKKLKEVFGMAGSILQAELKLDKEGTSRGMATIRYESAIEAIQAIAMFNGQYLYDRQMNVRMDKMAESSPQSIPSILPAGLKGVGFGLGPGGHPLINVGQITNTMIVSNLLSLSYGKFVGGLFNNIAYNMSPNANTGGGILGSSSSAGGAANSRTSGSRSFNPFLHNSGAFFGGLNGQGNNQSLLNDVRSCGWPTLPFGLGFGATRLPGVFNPSMNYHPNHFSQNNILPNGVGGGSSGSGLANGASNGASNHHMILYGQRQGAQEAATVLVKNLPYGTTWQTLKDKFKEAGDIQFADIKMENGKSRGIGSVRFGSSDDARRAITLLNGTKIEGRQIEVKFDV